jgi:hypothetical protein
MDLQEQKEKYFNRKERMNYGLQMNLSKNVTELSDNPAFPKFDKNGNSINFLELIAYKRFNDIIDKVNRYNKIQNPTDLSQIIVRVESLLNNIINSESENIQKLISNVRFIIVELKNYYKRPRPFRLDPKLADPMLKSMEGFAYP